MAVVLTALSVSLLVAIPLRMRTHFSPITLIADLMTAIVCAVLLADVFLFRKRSVPFTHIRVGSFNDLPLAFVQYVVAFPLFVSIAAHLELSGESSLLAGSGFLLLSVLLHALLQTLHDGSLSRENPDLVLDDADHSPQQLGLP